MDTFKMYNSFQRDQVSLGLAPQVCKHLPVRRSKIKEQSYQEGNKPTKYLIIKGWQT